ncbi:DNA internalization-related competence protein ComEC/Rec2 [Selenomonas sp. TAMA-11512]|uniref:DNA internalization-related competence protein ComEC/Rec2 n=1 Tax=Selenomonas sp. TAMA-11512 TaxID=3095337 RepID=UPI00308F2393|nr:DNA internalization-related competence protein ComEC/Rec2 [Selenomonas sp. TAMA-11512]
MKADFYALSFLNTCLLALGAGIFLIDYAVSRNMDLPSMLFLQGLLIALFLAAAAAVRLRHRAARYALIILCALLGAWRLLSVEILPAHDVSAYLGQEVQVTGTLLEAPRIRELPEGVSYRYTLEVGQAVVHGERKASAGRLYVSEFRKTGSEAKPVPEIGDILQAQGEIKPIHTYKNPGQIDFTRQAALHGVRGRLSARQGVDVTPADAHPVRRQIEHIRTFYAKLLAASMSEADAAAIFAMLFGGYEGVNPDLVEAFAVTGLIHILSVSGSHITLLAAVIAAFGRMLHMPVRMTTVLVLLAVGVYTALSGFAVPAVRSALMGGLACIALALERESDARRLLAILAIFLLLLEPRWLFDVSFLLSFAATGGLLYLAPVFHRRMTAWKTPRFISLAVSVTLAAQLAALPVMAWYFGRFSISAFLANIVLLPLVEIILMLALGAGILALCLPFLSKLVFAAASLLLGIVFEGTRFLSRLPYSEVHMAALPAWLTCVYYSLLSIPALPEEERSRLWAPLQKVRGRSLAGVLLMLFLGGILCTAYLKSDEMTVHFIDVGQGDAAVVVTPHGHAFMIDTGGTRDGLFDVGARVDVPYLRHHGVQRLDAIFLTHAHEDHAGGAGSVMKSIETGLLVTASEERREYAKSMQLPFSSALLDKRHVARTGERYAIDGVDIEVLYAPAAQSAAKRETGNELSTVIRVSYGDASFLFTGDLTAEQEAEVLRITSPRATVLKVAHHGSKTSSTDAFLKAAAPLYAVISVGANNTFGHPDPSVLERLETTGARVLRTDCDGAIRFATDGRMLRVKTYR